MTFKKTVLVFFLLINGIRSRNYTRLFCLDTINQLVIAIVLIIYCLSISIIQRK